MEMQKTGTELVKCWIGRSAVDEFKRFGFKHETREFLVGFCLKNDGPTIKTFIQEDFVRVKLLEAGVPQNKRLST